MPTPTYDLIASNVLTTTTANVTFSSIPSTYRDLVLVITGGMATGGNSVWFRFNNNTNAQYNRIYFQGNGSGLDTGTLWDSTSLYVSNIDAFDATNRNTIIFEFMDYAQSKRKGGYIRINRPGSHTTYTAFEYSNTHVVNSILCDTDGDYAAGTTFYLYGIAG